MPTPTTAWRRVFVPYRICLLGEHVDHQGGTTLSTNVDQGITLEYRPRSDGTICIDSDAMASRFVLSLAAPLCRLGHWSDFLKGMVHVLGRNRVLDRGFDGRLAASFPRGGISSSAAVQIAYAIALLDVNGIKVSRAELADSVVEAERGFVGVMVGRLDPLTILFADNESLLELDHGRNTMARRRFPRDRELPRFALVSSGIERSLAESPYNTRIDECARAAAALHPSAHRFGDVPVDAADPELLEDHTLRRRARHYFSEMERVSEGAASFEAGEFSEFCRAVDDCGKSCIDNFELGTPTMIELVEEIRSLHGVRAARFTGGGFGGAVLVILDRDSHTDPLAALTGGPWSIRHPKEASRVRVANVRLGACIESSGNILVD